MIKIFIELNEMSKIQKPTNFRNAKIETQKFDNQKVKTLGSLTIRGD